MAVLILEKATQIKHKNNKLALLTLPELGVELWTNNDVIMELGVELWTNNDVIMNLFSLKNMI